MGKRSITTAPSRLRGCSAWTRIVKSSVLLFIVGFFAGEALGASKRIVLIAGAPSHASGEHEYLAGCLLLQRCLQGIPGIEVVVCKNGWPDDEAILHNAAALFFYSDGRKKHPVLVNPARLRLLTELVKKGCGIGFAHYALDAPPGNLAEALKEWIGGHYEAGYSFNPVWLARFTEIPEHAVTRGVKPFVLRAEWYFNFRWFNGEGIRTPVLSARVPVQTWKQSAATQDDITDDWDKSQALMWVLERPDGGRGFGFAGGHAHVDWYDDEQRKLILNSLLWIAKVEIPSDGVQSWVPKNEIGSGLDPKKDSAGVPVVAGIWNLEIVINGHQEVVTLEIVQAGNGLLGRYAGNGNLGRGRLFGSLKEGRIVFVRDSEAHQDIDETAIFSGVQFAGVEGRGTVRFSNGREGVWRAVR